MMADREVNRMFARYGHDCELSHELDDMFVYYPGEGVVGRIKRAILRWIIVSEINKQSVQILRSQGAISAERCRQLKCHTFVIHPFSDLRKYWEYLMTITYAMLFLLIPMDVVSLISDIRLNRQHHFEGIIDVLHVICLIDIIVNLLTGYYNVRTKRTVLEPPLILRSVLYWFRDILLFQVGSGVTSNAMVFLMSLGISIFLNWCPKDFFRHYLKTYFFFDLFSSIPIHAISREYTNVTLIILHVGVVLKFIRIISFNKYVNQFFEDCNLSFAFHRSILIVFYVYLYVHVQLHILKAVHIVETPLANLSGNESRWMNQHLAADVYSSMIIISGSGYGMQAPTQMLEKIAVILLAIQSKIAYIFVIAFIKQVLRSHSAAKNKYVKMVKQLEEYMHYRQLPYHMQKRLLVYFEFRFQKSYFRESEILSTISGRLRQDMVMRSCRRLVENVSFFENLPVNLLVRIVSCLRSEIYLVNDVIIKANTPGDSMFFIATGTVAILTSSGREICHLEDGAHVGEIALVMHDELRVASVVAVEVCELYRLARKDFVRAIQPYPDLLENIQRIAAIRMERTTMLDEFNRREIAGRRLY